MSVENMIGREFTVEAPEALGDEIFKRILDSAPRFGLFVTAFSSSKVTGRPSTLTFSVMGLQPNIEAYKSAIDRFVEKSVADGKVPEKK